MTTTNKSNPSQLEITNRFRGTLFIICYATSIIFLLGFCWHTLIDEKRGVVIWTLNKEHGLHEGDLPAILIGVPLNLLMLLGIFREVRALRRTRRKST